MDEFFHPNYDINISEKLPRDDQLLSFLDNLDAKLDRRKKTKMISNTGIMFNCLDSNCVRLSKYCTSKRSGSRGRSRGRSYSGTTSTTSSSTVMDQQNWRRAPLSNTLCNQVNGTLHSRTHSKAFIKPSRLNSFVNPHEIPRITTASTINSYGVFRHFNNFRYSNDARWKIAALRGREICDVRAWVGRLLDESFVEFAKKLYRMNLPEQVVLLFP